ncbi:hypothetical protein ACSBR2_012219 [Camellia fascicularis]
MAAMAALQSSFTSISLFSNSFLGQRFSSPSLELLALGERIGNVNTGLSEDMISKCLRETKIYSDRSHEEGTLHLSYKKCNKLIAPAIAAGLGVFNAYIGHPRPYDRSKWICYNCSCNYYRNCCW